MRIHPPEPPFSRGDLGARPVPPYEGGQGGFVGRTQRNREALEIVKCSRWEAVAGPTTSPLGLASTLPESASERLRAAGRLRGAAAVDRGRARAGRGDLVHVEEQRTSVAVGSPGMGRLNRPLFLSSRPDECPGDDQGLGQRASS